MASSDHDGQRRDSMMAQLQELFAPPTAESFGKKGLVGIVSLVFASMLFLSPRLGDLKGTRCRTQMKFLHHLQPGFHIRMIRFGASHDLIATTIVIAAIAPRVTDLFVIAVPLVFI